MNIIWRIFFKMDKLESKQLRNKQLFTFCALKSIFSFLKSHISLNIAEELGRFYKVHINLTLNREELHLNVELEIRKNRWQLTGRFNRHLNSFKY